MTDEDKTAAFAAHRPAGLEPRSAFILVLADPEDPHHVAAHYVGPFLDEASAAAWHDELWPDDHLPWSVAKLSCPS
jgi:hypothetical protein